MTAELATSFTRLVGCRAPIQLVVMGGGTGTPELAAGVSQAGGLGMLSSTFPMSLEEQLSWVEERTERPLGVGFFAVELPTRTADLELAARRARVVDVFWGDPDAAVVERIHAGGAIAFWQVGSLDEAIAAADAGCDAVIAQGIEAGGHVRGTTPLATLLRQVIEAVEVPVIAAGASPPAPPLPKLRTRALVQFECALVSWPASSPERTRTTLLRCWRPPPMPPL